MLKYDKENPYITHYDYMMELAQKYDVTFSLGDALRPGSILDSHDELQVQEMINISRLAKRAKIEVYEEVRIEESNIKLIKEGKMILIESPQYENHQWEVYPFLFSCNNREVKLNWETSDSKWISANELNDFSTVPSLQKVLTRLF